MAELQRQADEEGDLDWHLTGQERPDLEAEALGRGRGGFSTKVHVRAEGGGKPMALLVTAGQRPEQVVFTQLMEHGAVKRLCPARVAGDRGYSSPMVRRYLRRRGIGAVIPTRRDQRRLPRFDRAAYRRRNVVEWLTNRLKQFRRVAPRYEKRAAT